MGREKEDYINLMERYHKGNDFEKKEVAEEMINDLSKFIYKIMHKEFPTYVNKHREDLYNEGVIGILTHLYKYNPEQCMPTTYFYIHIKHAMMGFMNKEENRTTTHYAINVIAVKKAQAELEKNKREVNVASLAIQSGKSIETVAKALDIINNLNTVSLADPSYEEYCTSEGFSSPEQMYLEKEKDSAIHKAISKLTELERKILFLKNGFSEKPMNYKEISERLEIPISRVKKELNRAMAKIKYDGELRRSINFYESKNNLLDNEIIEVKPKSSIIQLMDDVEDLDFGEADCLEELSI